MRGKSKAVLDSQKPNFAILQLFLTNNLWSWPKLALVRDSAPSDRFGDLFLKVEWTLLFQACLFLLLIFIWLFSFGLERLVANLSFEGCSDSQWLN